MSRFEQRPGGHDEPGCAVQADGRVELYFYDELEPAGRAAFEAHRAVCGDCRRALEELIVIRSALASRPVVTAPASGDWAPFMSRLDAVIGQEMHPAAVPAPAPASRSFVPLLAMAALLALVTISVLFVARSRGAAPLPDAQDARGGFLSEPMPGDTPADDTGFLSSVSQRHLERSKLVLLGLASKDAERLSGNDWTYERELASRLLTDTRLYRMAAEERGLDTLAGVMRDLELVLLQTSMTEGADPAALSQIQRAIRKRDLLQKMDVVRTSFGT
jgi:hypothetical protein